MKAGSESILAAVNEGGRKYSAFRVNGLAGKLSLFSNGFKKKKVSTRSGSDKIITE